MKLVFDGTLNDGIPLFYNVYVKIKLPIQTEHDSIEQSGNI